MLFCLKSPPPPLQIQKTKKTNKQPPTATPLDKQTTKTNKKQTKPQKPQTNHKKPRQNHKNHKQTTNKPRRNHKNHKQTTKKPLQKQHLWFVVVFFFLSLTLPLPKPTCNENFRRRGDTAPLYLLHCITSLDLPSVARRHYHHQPQSPDRPVVALSSPQITQSLPPWLFGPRRLQRVPSPTPLDVGDPPLWYALLSLLASSPPPPPRCLESSLLCASRLFIVCIVLPLFFYLPSCPAHSNGDKSNQRWGGRRTERQQCIPEGRGDHCKRGLKENTMQTNMFLLCLAGILTRPVVVVSPLVR